MEEITDMTDEVTDDMIDVAEELTSAEIEEIIADVPIGKGTVDLQDIFETIVLKIDPDILDPGNPPIDYRPLICKPMAIAWCLFKCGLNYHMMYKGEDWNTLPSINIPIEEIELYPCKHVPDDYKQCPS